MKQDLGMLGSVDMLTAGELRQELNSRFGSFIREWYRGEDFLAFYGTPNASLVTIPGPDSGYVWSLKLASVQLSAAGALSVYPGESSNVAPLGVAASIVNGTNNEAVITWTSNVVVLKDQRAITLFAGSQTILSYRLTVKQVPAEMQGKL